MSKPRTVREWIRRENAGTAELGETFREGEGDTYYTLRDGRANRILDALIGCQGRVVYTEESLLAAGHAYEDAHRAALDTNDYEAGLIAGARAALTAAGGVVADEVVEATERQRVMGTTTGGGSASWTWHIRPGDKLYIVRAKEATDGQEA